MMVVVSNILPGVENCDQTVHPSSTEFDTLKKLTEECLLFPMGKTLTDA
jgi:hypothetical protein